jgi:hypothetical protein
VHDTPTLASPELHTGRVQRCRVASGTGPPGVRRHSLASASRSRGSRAHRCHPRCRPPGPAAPARCQAGARHGTDDRPKRRRAGPAHAAARGNRFARLRPRGTRDRRVPARAGCRSTRRQWRRASRDPLALGRQHGRHPWGPGGSIGTPLDNAVGYGCWHVPPPRRSRGGGRRAAARRGARDARPTRGAARRVAGADRRGRERGVLAGMPRRPVQSHRTAGHARRRRQLSPVDAGRETPSTQSPRPTPGGGCSPHGCASAVRSPLRRQATDPSSLRCPLRGRAPRHRPRRSATTAGRTSSARCARHVRGAPDAPDGAVGDGSGRVAFGPDVGRQRHVATCAARTGGRRLPRARYTLPK